MIENSFFIHKAAKWYPGSIPGRCHLVSNGGTCVCIRTDRSDAGLKQECFSIRSAGKVRRKDQRGTFTVKAKQYRALVAALAAATTVASSAVPAMAEDAGNAGAKVEASAETGGTETSTTRATDQDKNTGDDAQSSGTADSQNDTNTGSAVTTGKEPTVTDPTKTDTDTSKETKEEGKDPSTEESKAGEKTEESKDPAEEKKDDSTEGSKAGEKTEESKNPAEEKKDDNTGSQQQSSGNAETKDHKTLSDGDKITVEVKEESVEGTAAVKGTVTVEKAYGAVKVETKDVTVDHTKVPEGRYVYVEEQKDGKNTDSYTWGWYKADEKNAPIKNGDGTYTMLGNGAVTIANGKTPYTGDTIEVKAQTEDVATVKTFTPADKDSSKVEAADITVPKDLDAGTYVYKTTTTGEGDSAKTTGSWYKSADVTEGTVKEGAAAVEGIDLSDTAKANETKKLTNGDQIVIEKTATTVEGKDAGTFTYTSHSEGPLTADEVEISADLADGEYTYIGQWYKTEDVESVENHTAKEGAEPIPANETGISTFITPSDGDTIKVDGHHDAVAASTKKTATVASVETKNDIAASSFKIPEDIAAGIYTYSASTQKWTNDKGEEAAITVDTGKSETTDPKGEIDIPGKKGSETDTGAAIDHQGGSTSGGSSSSGSGSGSSSGGSSFSGGSGSTSGGSSSGSTAGGTSGNGGTSNTGNNNGTNNGQSQNNGNNNGNNNGSNNGNNQNAGKTSDEVAVDTSEDSVTGLTTADGTEVNGVYQTADGVIIVNQAVDTEDGIVITDASGKAAPANSKVKYEGKTRLINEDRYLAINEKVTVKGKTFVAKKDGTAAKKAFVTLRTTGNRVYTNRTGAIVKNKAFKVKGKTYVAKKSGALVKNGTITIKGKKYTVKNYKVVKTVKVKKVKKARR